MLEKAKDLLQKNNLIPLLVGLGIGLTVGLLLLPSKKIQEEERYKYEQQVAKLKQSHSEEISSIKSELSEKTKIFQRTEKELSSKLNTLNEQITSLKSKQKTSYYKIVKPDGTIEIKKFSESETDESTKVISRIQDEFMEKVSSIEKKWSEIHDKRVAEVKKQFDTKEQEYQKTISELEKKKTIEINPKKFGVEVGFTSNNRYYSHVSADVWGPFFVGGHVDFDTKFPSIGVGGFGLGIRF